MGKQISPERQSAFYLGTGLMAVGILLIIIGFITFAALGVGSVNSSGHSTSPLVGFFMFFAGMVLAAVGQGIRGVAARGLAGSGVILDPEQARQDVEPWSRMAGGIAKDAIDETGILDKLGGESAPEDFDTQLRKLHKLREDGILSDQEYEQAKARILQKGL